jgi:Na+/H+-dicarboxylate symporter
MLIGFSTASSESAYPKLMEQLEKFGVKPARHRLCAAAGLLVQPRRLDDLHHLAAIFIAQAYGIDMPLTAQITMLLVLMVSSKGIAGVPRASLVVVAAVLPMFGCPRPACC